MTEYDPPITTVQPDGTVCPAPLHITFGVNVGETAMLIGLALLVAVLLVGMVNTKGRR